MKFIIKSVNHAVEILKDINEYKEIIDILDRFNEETLIEYYNGDKFTSLSNSISKYFDEKLTQLSLSKDSYIFKNSEYNTKRWTLNYIKNGISLNFAFDHNISICWNMLKGEIHSKPSVLNKNGDSDIQILITATSNFIREGGFDNATGSYEEYKRYLLPLNNFINSPMLIIGLDRLDTFYIQKISSNGKKIGKIISK